MGDKKAGKIIVEFIEVKSYGSLSALWDVKCQV